MRQPRWILLDATIDRCRRRVRKADRFLISVGMMDADHGCGRNTGSIPAGVENVETGIGNIVQFNQGRVWVTSGHAKGRTALVLRERTAAVLAAHRRLVIPIND